MCTIFSQLIRAAYEKCIQQTKSIDRNGSYFDGQINPENGKLSKFQLN